MGERSSVITFVLAFFGLTASNNDQQLLAAAQPVQRISEGPKNVTVLQGASVVLQCQVLNQVGPVMWTKDGFALGSDRELPAWSRYKMIGSSASGEYNLEIKDIHLKDDAMYQCQVGKAEKQLGHKSKRARLTVLVPPSPPRLNNGDLANAEENRMFDVSCSVNGSKPPAQIKWVITRNSDGTGIIRSFNESSVITSIQPDSEVFNVESLLKYIPKREDDEKFLACIATHEAVTEQMVAETMLRINYAPIVRIVSNNSKKFGGLKEDQPATFNCNYDAKPDYGIKFSWALNGDSIDGATSSELTIDPMTRVHHNGILECTAANSVGKGSSALNLDLKYGPRMPAPDVIAVSEGEALSLACPVDSNPPPSKITWVRQDNEQPNPVFKGANYTIESVSDWHEGDYMCIAEVPGFLKASTKFTVYINGPPMIVMPDSVEASVGDKSLDIACQIHGFPKPTSVLWYKNDQLLNFKNQPSYELLEHKQAEGMVSILKVKNVKETDFGRYNCSATNEYGSHVSQTSFTEADMYPLYIMIPCVVGASFLMVILVLCIVQCCCCRKSCSSKSSHRAHDEQSEVNVKVEAVDTNGQPISSYYAGGDDLYAGSNIIDINPNQTALFGKQSAGVTLTTDSLPNAAGSQQSNRITNNSSSSSASNNNTMLPTFQNPNSSSSAVQQCNIHDENIVDYLPIPQDNPDMDLLPPPYSSYHHNQQQQQSSPSNHQLDYQYSNSGQPISTFHPINNGHHHGSNGHLVQMTYIDDRQLKNDNDEKEMNDDSNGSCIMEDSSQQQQQQEQQPVLYTDQFGNILSTTDEQLANPISSAMNNGNPYGYSVDPNSIYYPTNSQYNIGAPLGMNNQLEPLPELPTPEHDIGGGLVGVGGSRSILSSGGGMSREESRLTVRDEATASGSNNSNNSTFKPIIMNTFGGGGGSSSQGGNGSSSNGSSTTALIRTGETSPNTNMDYNNMMGHPHQPSSPPPLPGPPSSNTTRNNSFSPETTPVKTVFPPTSAGINV